jgi:hypothetical protein
VAALRAAAAALLLVAGCASFVRLDSARTVAPGSTQWMLAPSLYLNQRQETLAGVNLDLLWRIGLTDRLDLGLRARITGVGGDLKLALHRSSDPRAGVDVAVAPGIGVGHDVNWKHTDGDIPAATEVTLPLIIGINLGQRQLVITPQLFYQRVATLPDGALNTGLTIAFGAVEGRGARLYPALALWKALDPKDPLGDSFRHGPLSIQPVLVFRWGS